MSRAIPVESVEPRARSGRSRFLARAARPAEILLGVVFLVSAVLKATDVNGFIVAIRYYGVIPADGLWGFSAEGLKTAAALGTLAVETGLGAALLLGMRPRWFVLGATSLLLVFFSVLIAYAWAFHGLTDCGCIGPIKMGPAASIFKNVVLLGLCAMAWLGFRARAGAAPGSATQGPARAVVALALAAAVAGYSYAHVRPPVVAAPGAQQRPFAKFVFQEDGIPYDLGKGEYLVAMLNMDCPHCKASVEGLNKLALDPNLPTTVALCDGNEETREEFKMEMSPEFPLHLVDISTFYALIGQAPPRIIYVRDGRQVKFWDEKAPTLEQVQQARQMTGGTASSSG